MANPNIRMIQQVQPGYFVLHVTTDAPDVPLEVGSVTPEVMQTAIDALAKAGGVELILDATSAETETPEKTNGQ